MEGATPPQPGRAAEFLTADYWHHPVDLPGAPVFKEWSHFCVM